MTFCLSVEKLAATFGHAILAVDAVSFAVRRDEIVAVSGAHGAGKSTPLQWISGLLPARGGQVTAGWIIFDHRDILFASPARLVRSGIVSVPEGRHCFPSLTVEESLMRVPLAGLLSPA